ncbi:hypothetical protein [Pedobacter nanyangensis]|uniref:hypothetical protein n=1 Tax=Pedobacter nanyangensis TaxID=1562389 RepID=UPI000DE4A0FF|nr:hypothetical protein [Pedobacter nanyangensis]
MLSQNDFIQINLKALGFTSKRDLVENLFLKSLIESYQRIAHTISTENEIRDRFMQDLYNTESQLKKWLQASIIYLDWENWKFTPENKLARADISFKLTGCEFIVECKRLKSADKLYFDEGLLRFLTLHYSKGHEYAGMIGFVINDKDGDILSGLKSKVVNYDYLSTDFVNSSFPLLPASFLSSHKRTDSSTINIFHLLFSFAQMAAQEEGMVAEV